MAVPRDRSSEQLLTLRQTAAVWQHGVSEWKIACEGMVRMKQSHWIVLIAALALAIRSVGFCATAAPSCVASTCAAHEQDRCCHQHQRHSELPSGHECCQSAICLSGLEFTAHNGGSSVRHLPSLLPVGFRLRLFDSQGFLTRVAALAEAHPPSPGVPIFLSLRTLLI